MSDEQPRPDLGDIVELCAVDWALHAEQLSANYEFDIVRGWIYGQVLRMTDDGITVAPQVFAAGDVRFALSVPWACISQITILQHAPDADDTHTPPGATNQHTQQGD